MLLGNKDGLLKTVQEVSKPPEPESLTDNR